MSSLAVRVVSALVGVTLLGLTLYLWGIQGLFVICTLCVVRCAYEYGRMVLIEPKVQVPFVVLTLVSFMVFFYLPDQGLSVLTLSGTLLFSIITLSVSPTTTLARYTSLQASSAMGLIYCCLFPVYVTRILYLTNGIQWFLVFILIVFAGDTFAYFTGLNFGRRKLLEPVSPKKTIEGSIGGLAGSLLIGALAGLVLSVSPVYMMILAAGTGIFAQIGDLFESLLKRVANVKDSGQIMPGHGGLLDRLDGIYFSAPFFYTLLSHFVV